MVTLFSIATNIGLVLYTFGVLHSQYALEHRLQFAVVIEHVVLFVWFALTIYIPSEFGRCFGRCLGGDCSLCSPFPFSSGVPGTVRKQIAAAQFMSDKAMAELQRGKALKRE